MDKYDFTELEKSELIEIYKLLSEFVKYLEKALKEAENLGDKKW